MDQDTRDTHDDLLYFSLWLQSKQKHPVSRVFLF